MAVPVGLTGSVWKSFKHFLSVIYNFKCLRNLNIIIQLLQQPNQIFWLAVPFKILFSAATEPRVNRKAPDLSGLILWTCPLHCRSTEEAKLLSDAFSSILLLLLALNIRL